MTAVNESVTEPGAERLTVLAACPQDCPDTWTMVVTVEGGGTEPWLVGLPGNPFAAFAAAYTTLASLLAGLSGRPLAMLPSLPVTSELRGHRKTTRLVPANWTEGGLRLMPPTSAAFLGAAARQHALAVLGPGWKAGQPARLILTDMP